MVVAVVVVVVVLVSGVREYRVQNEIIRLNPAVRCLPKKETNRKREAHDG